MGSISCAEMEPLLRRMRLILPPVDESAQTVERLTKELEELEADYDASYVALHANASHQKGNP